MKRKVHFVYCPRSGPRWLPEAGPRKGIVVPTIVWPNESAHVYGYQVSVRAAIPGRYWRNEAREAARAVALHFGGLAYDKQGDVSVVVREEIEARYAAAWFLMLHPRTDPALWTDREILALLDASHYVEEMGIALQVLSDTVAAFAAFVSINGRPVYQHEGPWWDARVSVGEKTEITVMNHYGHAEIVIRSPWNDPEIFGVADILKEEVA
jgi:hypothetical protein